MIHAVLSLLAFYQLADPLEAALRASEAPKSLRVAFDVELTSDSAVRVFSFDPRLDENTRWQLTYATGEDGYLDEIAASWGAETAPDGRLFPDDLRASLGSAPDIKNLGAAWKLEFQHRPSANDNEFDVWAAEQLDATAWLSPETGRFLRIEYVLPMPVRGPDGGRLLNYRQSYILDTDPTFGVSLVTSFRLAFEARGAFRRERRSYAMQTRNLEVFFATPEDEARFIANKAIEGNDLGGKSR